MRLVNLKLLLYKELTDLTDFTNLIQKSYLKADYRLSIDMQDSLSTSSKEVMAKRSDRLDRLDKASNSKESDVIRPTIRPQTLIKRWDAR